MPMMSVIIQNVICVMYHNKLNGTVHICVIQKLIEGSSKKVNIIFKSTKDVIIWEKTLIFPEPVFPRDSRAFIKAKTFNNPFQLFCNDSFLWPK